MNQLLHPILYFFLLRHHRKYISATNIVLSTTIPYHHNFSHIINVISIWRIVLICFFIPRALRQHSTTISKIKSSNKTKRKTANECIVKTYRTLHPMIVVFDPYQDESEYNIVFLERKIRESNTTILLHCN